MQLIKYIILITTQLFQMTVYGKWNCSFWLLLRLCVYYVPVWTIHKKLFLSITNKWDNPAHKSSWLSRSLGCHQLFLGASRSSRNSRKRLEFETNHVFDHFLAATSATKFFEGISGCIFCSPKISLMSHYWPLPKSWFFQK